MKLYLAFNNICNACYSSTKRQISCTHRLFRWADVSVSSRFALLTLCMGRSQRSSGNITPQFERRSMFIYYCCFFWEEPGQTRDKILQWSPGWPHVLHIMPHLTHLLLSFSLTVSEARQQPLSNLETRF